MAAMDTLCGPIGQLGPYTLEVDETGVRHGFTANENYWDAETAADTDL